jgi:hypothetical protein
MVSDTLSAKIQEIMTETGVFVPFIIRGFFDGKVTTPLERRIKNVKSSEPVFLNVYGAQEPIPMHQFRQPM